MTDDKEDLCMRESNWPRLAYRVDEAAEMLGVSIATVRRAIDAGQIPAVKMATSTIIIPAAIIQRLLGEAS